MPYMFSIADLRVYGACNLPDRIDALAQHIKRWPDDDEAFPMVTWAEITPNTKELIWALRAGAGGATIAAAVAADAASAATLTTTLASVHTCHTEDAVRAAAMAAAAVTAADAADYALDAAYHYVFAAAHAPAGNLDNHDPACIAARSGARVAAWKCVRDNLLARCA